MGFGALTAGVSASFYQIHEEANERNVVDYLSFAPENPSSIKNCIENAIRVFAPGAPR